VTKRRGPSPEPTENREEPGRPSAPPPPLSGLGSTTEALPEATTADGGAALSQEERDRLYRHLDYDAYDWIKGRQPAGIGSSARPQRNSRESGTDDAARPLSEVRADQCGRSHGVEFHGRPPALPVGTQIREAEGVGEVNKASG